MPKPDATRRNVAMHERLVSTLVTKDGSVGLRRPTRTAFLVTLPRMLEARRGRWFPGGLRLLATVVSLHVASACRCDDAGDSTARANSATTAATSNATPQASGTVRPGEHAAKPVVDEAQIEKRARTLLERWKQAQNDGDRAGYLGFYHPEEFEGLKRTHDGKVSRYDVESWKADRSAMFHAPFEVVVESPRIESWLSPESSLRRGIVRVEFLQRWRSKRYADHGPKSMLLW